MGPFIGPLLIGDGPPRIDELHIMDAFTEFGGTFIGLRFITPFKFIFISEPPPLKEQGTLSGLGTGEPIMLPPLLHEFIGTFEGLPIGDPQFKLFILCEPITDIGLPF